MLPDSKYYLALCSGCGWLIGIWLGSQGAPILWPWLLIAGLATVSAVLWWRVGRLGLLLATVAALAFGAARYVSSLPQTDVISAAAFNGQDQVVVYGQVQDEPQVQDSHIQLRVAIEKVVVDGRSTELTDVILVRAPRFPLIPYGSSVRLVGELQSPSDTSSADYAAYLERQGIRSEMSYPQLTVIESGGGSVAYRTLLALKNRARASIERSIPEPQASLLVGILLGDDSGLAKEILDAFRRTGMTHIIAISGFNIALLIALADRLTLPVLPRRSAAVVVMGFIAAYAALVGGTGSVIRAAIMGGVYLLSMRFLGRPTLAMASLLLTAMIMTAVQPATLWDVGFQLSFAATLGLMLFAGSWTRWLQERAGRPVTRLVGEGLVVTLAAQVLALPLILYYFGQLSLISLPANLLILPAQPGVMMSGGITALAGMAVPQLGQVAGWVSWLFLAYTTSIVELLAAVPGASVQLPLTIGGLLGTYAFVALATIAIKRRNKTEKPARAVSSTRAPALRWAALAGTLLLALLVGLWSTSQADGLLHVSFLDVGQGDAILVVTPGGRQVLVDGGRYPTTILDELGREVPFWDRSLDIVVATHPDDDHIAGLVAVLERYQVDMLLINGAIVNDDPAYTTLLATAAERGTQLHVAETGEQYLLDQGTSLVILHPAADFHGDDTNAQSIVGRLSYGDLSILLTGDAENDVEEMLIDHGDTLSSTVLKVGHHGSKNASGEDFLRVVRPQVAIISAGKDNSYGHPHPDVLARLDAIGATVLRTDESGTLELTSDGRNMWWQAQH